MKKRVMILAATAAITGVMVAGCGSSKPVSVTKVNQEQEISVPCAEYFTDGNFSITRMQSAIVVYIKSNEKNFTQKVSLLEPKLKASLSQRGCSYTANPESADWLLTIEASTRQGREVDEIFFSYLDVIISLTERKTGKEIYGNNFTDLKGGGLDYVTAGRKAYDASLQRIVDEIAKVLEK